VERGVELDELVFVATRRGRRHARAQAVEPLECRGIHRARRARRGPDLDPAAQSEDLLRLARIERGHDGAAMAFAQDQAVFLQPHQRFADGALAAAEVGRQGEFRQDHARPQRVEHDAALDRGVDRVPRPHRPSQLIIIDNDNGNRQSCKLQPQRRLGD
jgi:hypothetical protein